MTAQYQVNGETFRAEAARRDHAWGNGISVRITTATGALLAIPSFSCHPEFLGYAECQAMSMQELLAIAVAQLEAGVHAHVLAGAQSGLQLVCRLNGTGQEFACAVPPP